MIRVTAAGYSLNVNRLQVYMREQGEGHAEWWAALKRGNPRNEIVDAIIENGLASGAPRPEWEVEVLRTAKMERMSQTEINEAISEVAERLSVPLVLGSHFQFSRSAEEQVPLRADLKHALVEAAETLGHSVFDPSETVIDYGRDRALKRQGADIAHYTDEFLPVLAPKIVECVTR